MTRISQEDIPSKLYNSKHKPNKFSKTSSLEVLIKSKSPPKFKKGPGLGISIYSSPPRKLVDLSSAHGPNSILSPSTDKKGTAAGTGRSTNNTTGLLITPKGSTLKSSPSTALMRQQKMGALAGKPNITSQASTASLIKMSASNKQLPRTRTISSENIVTPQQRPLKPGFAP